MSTIQTLPKDCLSERDKIRVRLGFNEQGMDRVSRASNQAAVPLHFLEMFQSQRRKHELRPIFHHSHLDFLRKSRSRIEGFELIPTDFTSDKKPTPLPHLFLAIYYFHLHFLPRCRSKSGIKGYFGHYLPEQYVSQLTRDNPRLGYDQFSLCLHAPSSSSPSRCLILSLLSSLSLSSFYLLYLSKTKLEQGVPIMLINFK